MNAMINENWTFRDLVLNAKMLKQEYVFVLAFFSNDNVYEEIKIRNIIIKSFKNKLYSINIEEWKLDKVWEYMNGDIGYPLLRYIARIDKDII